MQFDKVKAFILNKLNQELPVHLTYHNLNHIQDVLDMSEKIGEMENISGEELILLLTAALFHDTGYIKQSRGHEELSCSIAQDLLPQFDYNPDQIEYICQIIMATKIPQNPKTILAEILCDADLDYLGRDDFFSLSNDLYMEMLYNNLVSNENEWNEMQVSFFKNHHFFTETSIQARNIKKAEHLAKIESKLNKII